MSDPATQAHELHDAMLLLPWYAGGALAEGERALVEAHLRDCPACRAELESIVDLKKRFREMFAATPMTPARLRAAPPSAHLAGRRSLMRPKWTAAVAASVIAVQAGIIGWLALHDVPQPKPQSRSVEPATTARIRIVFGPQANETEIRAALAALGGRVVDVSSTRNAYLIELPPVAPAILSQRLRELRARPGIVERIENATP